MERRTGWRFATTSLVALLASAPVTTSTLQAQEAAVRIDAAALDSAFHRMVEIHRLVGLQVAIAGSEGILYEGSFGLADVEHHVPVTAASRFPSASVGKAFTAAALLRLADRGAVELDAPVTRYVPRLPARLSSVTARLLALHQAGIRHYTDRERTPAFRAAHYEDVDDALDLFLGEDLVAPPGSTYSYSSYGYNLLAAAVQSAAGIRFRDFVRDSILVPLGATHTVFDDVRHPIEGRVRLYGYSDPMEEAAPRVDELFRVPSAWDYSYNAGGGNWLTTARDLATVGLRLLTGRFLSDSARRLMTEPASLPDGSPTEAAMGWFAGPTHLGPTARINGAFVGSYADVRVFPESRLAIALMTNTSSVGNVGYATSGIAEYLLGTAASAQDALEGALWFQFHRWDRAAAAYRSLTSRRASDEWSALQLGVAELNAGHLDAARSALANVHSARLRDEVLYYRIVLETRDGHIDAAVRVLTEWHGLGTVNWGALEAARGLAPLRDDPRYKRLRGSP